MQLSISVQNGKIKLDLWDISWRSITFVALKDNQRYAAPAQHFTKILKYSVSFPLSCILIKVVFIKKNNMPQMSESESCHLASSRPSLPHSLGCYQHNTSYYSKYKIYSWEIINISGPSVNKSSPSRPRYWPIHGHQNTVTQSVEPRIRDELSDTRWFWRGSGRAWCIRLHHLIKITTCKLGKYIYIVKSFIFVILILFFL